MGNCFQSVVDLDATEEEAPKLAADILGWLVGEGIVLVEQCDCVLGSEAGNGPGPNYVRAVSAPDDHFLRDRTNGLDVITKRTVFHSGQGGFELICAACSAHFDPTDAWGTAMGEWHEKRGPGLLPCANCGQPRPITEWRHDPEWGFGNLGFEFWNWPELKPSFVEELGTRLGHRVVLVSGKL